MISNLIVPESPMFVLTRKIGELLKLEFQNQVSIANVLGVDPQPYDVRVFTETTLPIDSILKTPEKPGNVDLRSIVTIRFDSANLEAIQSNQEYQHYLCQYHIDVMGIGIAKSNGTGQIKSDKLANENLFSTFSLVQKILNANGNVRLGYDAENCPIQLNCKIKNYETFSIDQQDRSTVALQCGRISLETMIRQDTLTVSTGIFESANIKVIEADGGELLLEIESPTN